MSTRAPDTAAASDLADAVHRLSRASALVVGDAILDRYVYGETGRSPPEEAAPVLLEQREVAMPGGAGNLVRHLTALGVAVAFISVVGDDQTGSDLTGLVGGQPNVEPWLLVEGGRTTTARTRYFAGSRQLLRADREQTAPIDERLADRILRIARDSVAATSVTVLSDHGKGLLAGPLAAQLIAAARQAGRRVIVDPAGRDFARYAGADLLTPSRQELADATGLPTDTRPRIVAAARAMRERHEFGAILVIGAEHGMALIRSDDIRHFPPAPAGSQSSSRTSDRVLATLVGALAAGIDLADAAQLASLADGIVVGVTGGTLPRQADLLAAISAGRHDMIEQSVPI